MECSNELIFPFCSYSLVLLGIMLYLVLNERFFQFGLNSNAKIEFLVRKQQSNLIVID